MITETIKCYGACSLAECDTFQLMAKYMGFMDLHPGGLASTDTLIQRFGLKEGMTVLDARCS